MPTDMFFGATPTIFENAKKLREAMTPVEAILWEYLKHNQLGGFRFKAQHPINYFVADFYCHKAQLVVEIDGDIHDVADQVEHDKNRTYILSELGLTVIRFRNDEVTNRLDFVLNEIKKALTLNKTA